MGIRPMTLPLLVLIGLLATGCASQAPLAYHDASEIPRGPGLISGEDGVFGYRFEGLGHLGADHSKTE